MKQRWVVQGKLWAEPNGGWLTLKECRSRKDCQINRVRFRARKYGLKADYRAILIYT